INTYKNVLFSLNDFNDVEISQLPFGFEEIRNKLRLLWKGKPLQVKENDLLTVLSNHATSFSDKVALFDNLGSVSYKELWEKVCAVSGGLQQLGFSVGSRIGLQSARNRYQLYGVLGIWHMGGVYVPLD